MYVQCHGRSAFVICIMGLQHDDGCFSLYVRVLCVKRNETTRRACVVNYYT